MAAKVQKWGNSLGIRIPKDILEKADLHENENVEISIQDDNILIMPIRKKKFNLKTLLSKISNSNLHDETDTYEVVGKEIW